MGEAGRAEKAKPEEGLLASFDCMAKSESFSRAFIPGSLGLFAAIASSLFSEPSIAVLLLILVAILPALAPTISTVFPRTKSKCMVGEKGMRIIPYKPPKARGRFLAWGKLSRFSAKPMGLKGGRIYLYPKGPFGVFRREVIEPLEMSHYYLLFNQVSSRIGLI